MEKEDGTVRSLFKYYLENERTFYLITGVSISVFLYLLFSYSNIHTDVDDAITSGVEAYLAGHNPYQEDVVVHHLPVGIIYGRYHYFPPDLLTYSAFYLLFGSATKPFLGTYWFAPLHFMLLVPGYWIVSQLVDWPHRRLAPFYLLLLTPFLFTNSMLMWFFFMIGYYFYEEKQYKHLGMIFYVFAASVKYMVGFIIVFYFLRSVSKAIRENREQLWSSTSLQEFGPYISGSLALIIISIPFNLLDVITSVFLYQGDPSARGDVAQSVGPILIEILKFFEFQSIYLPCVVLILILALIIIRNQTYFEKIMHISFLVMFILPFYGTELFITLPFYWWLEEGIQSFPREEKI